VSLFVLTSVVEDRDEVEVALSVQILSYIIKVKIRMRI
jgi:hypothetical protein